MRTGNSAEDAKYQQLVASNVELFKEVDRLSAAQESVAREILGEGDIAPRLRAALTMQWLLRLYARRVGEARLLKEVERFLGCSE